MELQTPTTQPEPQPQPRVPAQPPVAQPQLQPPGGDRHAKEENEYYKTDAPAPAAVTQTNEDLSVALKQIKLEQYEAALRELGCAMASDHVPSLEESDMVEIGMKKIDIKRLQRST
eukprot:COSAG06_NODE_7945_length_2327_cov_1.926391_1_plen_115_part_10